MNRSMISSICLMYVLVFLELESCSGPCICGFNGLAAEDIAGIYVSNDDDRDSLFLRNDLKYIHKLGTDSISQGDFKIEQDCQIILKDFHLYIPDIIELRSGRKIVNYWLQYCLFDDDLYVNIVDWSGEMGYRRYKPGELAQ